MTLLTTSRLRLEPFTEGHLAGLNKMNSDPEVMRYLSAGRPETLEETRAIIGRVMKRWVEVGYSWWALLERETEELVGAPVKICGEKRPLYPTWIVRWRSDGGFGGIDGARAWPRRRGGPWVISRSKN